MIVLQNVGSSVVALSLLMNSSNVFANPVLEKKNILKKEGSGLVKQPNFVFVLMDDMGWKDLGCTGSSFYETPNLDKLASEGVRFTNAYAACPVCSPTRASILTGKYPATVGITNYISGHEKGKLLSVPYLEHLPLEETTFADILRENGYKTYFIGKWHLGGKQYYPDKHGFDVNIAGCEWGHPKSYFSPYGMPTMADGPDGEYLVDRLTDEAINLIKNNGDKPFFLYLSHYAVHIPIQAKEEYIEKFSQKAKSMGLDKLKIFQEGEFFPFEDKKNKHVVRRLVQSSPEYAAMIYSVDENIGRLLAVLKETGKSDNTIIIFTSDNGGLATAEGSPTSNLPLAEGKGWMYEGGTKEPLIIKWPGTIKPGTTCDVPVTSPDFFPTILEIAGIKIYNQKSCEGISIVPLLKGSKSIERDAIFWHFPHYGRQGGTPGSSIRCGDYKLIEFFEDGKIELYNLQEDCGELHELSKEKPEIAGKLKNMLAEWRKSVEAKIPEKNPQYGK